MRGYGFDMTHSYRIYIGIILALSNVSLPLLSAGLSPISSKKLSTGHFLDEIVVVVPPHSLASAENLVPIQRPPTLQECIDTLTKKKLDIEEQLEGAKKLKADWIDLTMHLQARKAKSEAIRFNLRQKHDAWHMHLLEKRKFYRCIAAFNDIHNQCQAAHELIEQQEFNDARKIIKEIYEKIIDLEQGGLPQEAIKECTIACAEIEKNWYPQICNTINDIGCTMSQCHFLHFCFF